MEVTTRAWHANTRQAAKRLTSISSVWGCQAAAVRLVFSVASGVSRSLIGRSRSLRLAAVYFQLNGLAVSVVAADEGVQGSG